MPLNLEGNTLSHYKKDLIGLNRMNYKDKEGRFLVKELIYFAKINNNGFMIYSSTINPNKLINNNDKVSYVTLFPEWGLDYREWFLFEESK